MPDLAYIVPCKEPLLFGCHHIENETANAVSYENSGLGQYKEYQNGSLGQHSTNKFMSDWLDNIEQQEYKISRAIAEYHNCDLDRKSVV